MLDTSISSIIIRKLKVIYIILRCYRHIWFPWFWSMNVKVLYIDLWILYLDLFNSLVSSSFNLKYRNCRNSDSKIRLRPNATNLFIMPPLNGIP